MYQILQNKFYTNAGHNNLEKKTKTCFLQVGYEKLKPLINLFFFLFHHKHKMCVSKFDN